LHLLHAYYFDGIFLELLFELLDDALTDLVLLALAVDLPAEYLVELR